VFGDEYAIAEKDWYEAMCFVMNGWPGGQGDFVTLTCWAERIAVRAGGGVRGVAD